MIHLRFLAVPLLVLVAWIGLAGPAVAAPPAPRDKTVEITTVPSTPDARFALDGVPLVTDPRGIVRFTVPRSKKPHRLELQNPTMESPGTKAEFVRWHGYGGGEQGYNPVMADLVIDRALRLQVAFRVNRVVQYSFVDQARRPVPPERIESITLRSDLGRTQTLAGGRPVLLTAVRPTLGDGQLVAKESTWSVQSVMIDGTNVVTIGEQRFRPSQVGERLEIVVLLRSAHLRVRDRLLGTPVQAVVHLTLPNGVVLPVPTDDGGEAVVNNLARGTYTVTAQGQAYAVDQELALSRSQFVDVRVLTHLDAVILTGIGVVAVTVLCGLGLWRSRLHRRRLAEPAPAPAATTGAGPREEVVVNR
ncbi:hypothetical protein [Pseudonocardia acidicola]|uniref:Carboxypeptidase regulatory-like domain-containing protein n=1 Tax=Pseudonocardia acidicola TaxID=2724939 RepID=A0ABX1SH09_9PSEU|nr:hypothetical protein [Pseudonocardia acidicola]NMI00073.1 hypothetical protein [Pseudonocardia acidicola]